MIKGSSKFQRLIFVITTLAIVNGSIILACQEKNKYYGFDFDETRDIY